LDLDGLSCKSEESVDCVIRINDGKYSGSFSNSPVSNFMDQDP